MAMKNLTSAGRRGRVDGVIQSTDKNFMVPVGGAILATLNGNNALVEAVSKLYPGRASCSAVQDLFITLLSMGEAGYLSLLKEREEMLPYFKTHIQTVAAAHGERLLETQGNGISLALSLDTFISASKGREGLSQLGGMLFARACSGTRVVTCVKKENVGGISFVGYGAHMDKYPVTYLSFACAIGITKSEVDKFVTRLDKTLKEFRKKIATAENKESTKASEDSSAVHAEDLASLSAGQGEEVAR